MPPKYLALLPLTLVISCQGPSTQPAPIEPITTDVNSNRPAPQPIVEVPAPVTAVAPTSPATQPDLRQLKPGLVARKLTKHLALPVQATILDLCPAPSPFAQAFRDALPNGTVKSADLEHPKIAPGSADLIFFADGFPAAANHLQHLKAALSPNGAIAMLEFKDGHLPIGPAPRLKTTQAQRHQILIAAGLTLEASLATHIWQDLEIWSRTRVTR